MKPGIAFNGQVVHQPGSYTELEVRSGQALKPKQLNPSEPLPLRPWTVGSDGYAWTVLYLASIIAIQCNWLPLPEDES